MSSRPGASAPGRGVARSAPRHAPPPPPERFLSREACLALLQRAHSYAVGGGTTTLSIESRWSGNLRWGRNQVWTSGDIRDTDVWLIRDVRGARAKVVLNTVDDAAVHAAVRRAERLVLLAGETGVDAPPALPAEDYPKPPIWSEVTYTLDAERRAEVVARVTRPAREAGVLGTGYVEVAGQGRTVLDSDGRIMYYPYTTAQCSITVRDPARRASGWAGVDHHDWTKIDADQLAATALDKCLTSRDPVRLEPGRYVAILEPQAVCDLVKILYDDGLIPQRGYAESGQGPYAVSGQRGRSKLGQGLIDERITITADPMDPELGVVPFDREGNVLHAAAWFEQGVLTDLAYPREYAVKRLGRNTGLLNSKAFKLSGGTAGTSTIEEMIQSTKRGVLVTRFSNVTLLDRASVLLSGYTRDGTWLVEDGKIAKPVVNFRITESPLFVLNNVEMLGVPRRVFHPGAPVVVPALKVRDFNFAGLADAV